VRGRTPAEPVGVGLGAHVRDSGGGDGLDPGHDIGVLVGVVQVRRVAVVRGDIGTGDGFSKEAVHNCDFVPGLCIECLPQPKALSAQRIELTVRQARPFHPMFGQQGLDRVPVPAIVDVGQRGREESRVTAVSVEMH
jgi:hypothetical protein